MDTQIYERNIEVLRQIQPKLVDELESIDLENQDYCIVFEGQNGHNVLKVKNQDDNYILYNSFYDPYKEAKELTIDIDYEVNRSLITVIGVGMGYHIKEILSNLNEKTRILVIEKDRTLFKNYLYYNDVSEDIEEGKVHFIVGDFEKDEINNVIGVALRRLFVNIFSIQAQLLPIIDIDYIKFCKRVLATISDHKTNLIFAMGNDIDDTILGIENRINNLSQTIQNPGLNDFLKEYKDVYKDKPAIVIASGPSLDKNIHLLKKAAGKSLLLACDGSMDSLKKYDITPDVVSSIERVMITYEAFYKGKKMPDDTVLVSPAVVRPEIFQSFETKTLSLFKDESISEWFNQMVYDKGRVWSGLCVAHQLVGIAKALGASPIILVGQDLAYSPEGVSHTSEASIKEEVNVNEVEVYVKDVNGNELPSTFVWKQFLDVYERGIKGLDIDCIDASEGGAYIRGTKVMTLNEVIDKYCNVEVPKFRQLVDNLEVDQDYIREAYRNVLKGLIKLSKKFYLVQKRCEKSLEINDDAKSLLEKGIDTDEELDEVYDAIDYTEYKVVRKIMKSGGLNMFFQYAIMKAVDKINALGTEITFDVLSKNLYIQKEMLHMIQHYSKEVVSTIKTGYDHMQKEALDHIGKDEVKKIEYPTWIK